MLKIAGFNGKYGESRAVSAPVSKSAESATKSSGNAKVSAFRNRPDSSFKIKDSLRQVSNEHPDIKKVEVNHPQEKIEAREAFTEETLLKAVEQYIVEAKAESMIAIALQSHHPSIEGEKVTFWVDNQLQLDKLESLHSHFSYQMTKTLQNGFITIEFKLFDTGVTKEEKKLFTAGEKFEHFVRLNPVVADLKNIFGLELD